MKNDFRFQPISFSWVALHPQPKGVVIFMGGAFFGTFPTLFYRYFLRNLFEAGYTIVAMPFRFSFRHWPIAISLLKEQINLREEMVKMAKYLNQTEPKFYHWEIYQNPKKYFWVGHSLGCKYLTLLEFFSDQNWATILMKCAKEQKEGMLQRIEKAVKSIPLEQRSIKGQPSLLIAPDISDTQSAIPRPLGFIARFLDRKGWGVLPTKQQTKCFINDSRLFQLTGLISFDHDRMAGNEKNQDEDVFWMIKQLSSPEQKFPLLHQELAGRHLEPLGIQLSSQRPIETVTLRFLEALRKREEILRAKEKIHVD